VSESLSPREALAEHCPDCDGMGEWKKGIVLQVCATCRGSGRRVRERSPSTVLAAAGHMLLDRTDQVLAEKEDRIRILEAELKHARTVVSEVLPQLEEHYAGRQRLIDPAGLVRLRDLVRKP